MIDPAMGWLEIAEMKDSNNSADASRIFNNSWLSRYPYPKRIIYDNGVEFKNDFKPLLKTYGIKPKRIKVKNPQANAVLDRVHQIVGDMLCTKDLEVYPFNIEDPWTEILSSVAWAINGSYHKTKEAIPGESVYGRDMIFHDTFKANWQAIHMRKASDTLLNTASENRTRSNHKYKVGDYAFISIEKLSMKFKAPHEGLYRINNSMQATNSTVKVQRGPVEKTINIRRLIPFKG